MFSRARMHLRVFMYVHIYFGVYTYVHSWAGALLVISSAISLLVKNLKSQHYCHSVWQSWEWADFGGFWPGGCGVVDSRRDWVLRQSLNESHIWMNEAHKRMTASHICDTDMNKSPMIRPFSWTDQQRNPILLPNHVKHTNQQRTPYWVATISRLLKIIYHFARISSFYRALLQKRPVIWRSTLIVATPYLELNESCHISPTLLSRHTSIQQRISFYDPHIDKSRHKLR